MEIKDWQSKYVVEDIISLVLQNAMSPEQIQGVLNIFNNQYRKSNEILLTTSGQVRL